MFHSPSPKQLVKAGCRLLLQTRRDVTVDVERGADRRVTQSFLDYLGVRALGQHQGSMSVPEVVEAECDTGLPDNKTPTVPQCMRVNWLSQIVRKHQVVILPVGASS